MENHITKKCSPARINNTDIIKRKNIGKNNKGRTLVWTFLILYTPKRKSGAAIIAKKCMNISPKMITRKVVKIHDDDDSIKLFLFGFILKR